MSRTPAQIAASKRHADWLRQQWKKPKFRQRMLTTHNNSPLVKDQLNRLHESLRGIPRSAEVREKIGKAQRGIPRGPLSAEHRKKLSEKAKQNTNPEHIQRMCAAARKASKEGSRAEKLTAEYLQSLKIKHEREKAVHCPLIRGHQTYWLDFYLPKFKIDLECDCSYWHGLPKWKERDAKRDRFLRSQGIKVIRVSSEAILKGVEKVILPVLRRHGIAK